MALPSSGVISMYDINIELGNSGTATITLNDSAARSLAGVASGTIALSDFYGKSAVIPPLFVGVQNQATWAQHYSQVPGMRFDKTTYYPQISSLKEGQIIPNPTASVALPTALHQGGLLEFAENPWADVPSSITNFSDVPFWRQKQGPWPTQWNGKLGWSMHFNDDMYGQIAVERWSNYTLNLLDDGNVYHNSLMWSMAAPWANEFDGFTQPGNGVFQTRTTKDQFPINPNFKSFGVSQVLGWQDLHQVNWKNAHQSQSDQPTGYSTFGSVYKDLGDSGGKGFSLFTPHSQIGQPTLKYPRSSLIDIATSGDYMVQNGMPGFVGLTMHYHWHSQYQQMDQWPGNAYGSQFWPINTAGWTFNRSDMFTTQPTGPGNWKQATPVYQKMFTQPNGQIGDAIEAGLVTAPSPHPGSTNTIYDAGFGRDGGGKGGHIQWHFSEPVMEPNGAGQLVNKNRYIVTHQGGHVVNPYNTAVSSFSSWVGFAAFSVYNNQIVTGTVVRPSVTSNQDPYNTANPMYVSPPQFAQLGIGVINTSESYGQLYRAYCEQLQETFPDHPNYDGPMLMNSEKVFAYATGPTNTPANDRHSGKWFPDSDFVPPLPGGGYWTPYSPTTGVPAHNYEYNLTADQTATGVAIQNIAWRYSWCWPQNAPQMTYDAALYGMRGWEETGGAFWEYTWSSSTGIGKVSHPWNIYKRGANFPQPLMAPLEATPTAVAGGLMDVNHPGYSYPAHQPQNSTLVMGSGRWFDGFRWRGRYTGGGAAPATPHVTDIILQKHPSA